MSQKKPIGKIAVIVDERLSREKAAILTRIINSFRQFVQVECFSGMIEEERLLEKLESEHFNLVLAPWYRYLAWSRVEAFYGLTRTSGPTFAGYFCESVLPYELGEQADHLRAILLDFAYLSISEIHILIKMLIQDTWRSGIRRFFDSSTPVYCESWYGGQGLGLRTDTVLGLPGIAATDWVKRSNAIRICLSALWSLIYEEGPGKGEFVQVVTGSSPKAYFQVAADSNCLVFRLCYAMPNSSPKDVLNTFWPNPKKPSSAMQLLVRFCDFMRIHPIADASDVEVVVGFLGSAPAEQSSDGVHTFWVEPMAANLVHEIPYTNPGPDSPYLKYLPAPQIQNQPSSAKSSSSSSTIRDKNGEKAKERFIFEAASKLRELRRQIEERDFLIKELKTGGIGTAPPLPPPDAEALLDAFQEKFFEARFQIRQFELQIAGIEKNGGSSQQIETLQKKMGVLTGREKEWLKKIAQTLEMHRTEKKKAQG